MGETTRRSPPAASSNPPSSAPLGAAFLLVLLVLLGAQGCVPAGDGSAESATEGESEVSSASASGVTLTTPWASTTAATAATAETASAGDTSTAGTSEDSGESEATDASTDPTGGDTEDDGQEPPSCKKLDFLLAIDNSFDNFPARNALSKLPAQLAGHLEAEFSDWDVHTMVIRGDDWWGLTECDERCALQGNCDGFFPEYPCDYEPVPCDRTLGAGVRAPAGLGGANQECPIPEGRRYLHGDDPDLEGTLDCVRKIPGASSGMRRQMESIFRAVGPELNAPGACNAGFYRDDAYLVVMMVTTEYDWFTEGGPDEWAERLLAVKGGKFDQIFLIGLYGNWMCGGVGESAYFFDFAEQIYHSITGTYCEKDYQLYIDAAFDFLRDDCPA